MEGSTFRLLVFIIFHRKLKPIHKIFMLQKTVTDSELGAMQVNNHEPAYNERFSLIGIPGPPLRYSTPDFEGTGAITCRKFITHCPILARASHNLISGAVSFPIFTKMFFFFLPQQ